MKNPNGTYKLKKDILYPNLIRNKYILHSKLTNYL